jgi:hypothetical protein
MAGGTTRTIRFDKDLDDALQAMARNERMSVNAIVNDLVRRYVGWDRYSDRVSVEVSPSLLVEVLSRFSLDEAKEMGRRMANDLVRTAIDEILVDFTFENVVEFFRRFAKYTRRFDFEDTVEGRTHVMLVRHSLGLKWSAYYAGMFQQILEKELGLKIEERIGPQVCSVRLELPEDLRSNVIS